LWAARRILLTKKDKDQMAQRAEVERAVSRAASRISMAMDEMIASLPMETEARIAIVHLVRKLAQAQRQPMQWIMEDFMVRQAYAETSALHQLEDIVLAHRCK
jgi:rhamnogalacturonyl hydrolase YesR